MDEVIATGDREILTLQQVAEYLQVHVSTIYRQIKRKEIPFFKIGSDYRFNKAKIVEWCEAKQQQQSK